MSAGKDQNQAAPQDARPLRRAWKMISHGEQFKATVVLLTMTVSMVTWKYFGSPEFYDQGLSRRLSLGGDPQVLAAVYCFLASFVLLGVIPALIVKFVFRERLADYGAIGDPQGTFRSMAIFVPIFLVSGYTGSLDWPCRRISHQSSAARPAMFVLHATTYFLFYLGWEFGFRGFMQIGRGSMGSGARCCLHSCSPSRCTSAGPPPRPICRSWAEFCGRVVTALARSFPAPCSITPVAGLVPMLPHLSTSDDTATGLRTGTAPDGSHRFIGSHLVQLARRRSGSDRAGLETP